MSYEEYWYGDPLLIWDYIEADKLRQERFNQEAWLQGMYNYHALVSALSVNELFRGKGQRPTPYPDKPYELQDKEKDRPKTEEEEEAEALRAKLYMQNMVRMGKHWGTAPSTS